MWAHNLYYIHILKDKKCCTCPLKGIFVPGKMFAIFLFCVRRLLSCIILTICSVYLTLNPGQHKIKAGIYMSIAVIPLQQFVLKFVLVCTFEAHVTHNFPGATCMSFSSTPLDAFNALLNGMQQ